MKLKTISVFCLVVTVCFVLLTICSETFASVSVESLSPGVVFLQRDYARESPSGTGFFLASGSTLYLVTASHVSRILSLDSPITIATTAGRPFTFLCRSLVPGATELSWFVHPQADVAVLRLNPTPDFLKDHLDGHFMPSTWLESAKQAPLRAITLTVLGFPLKLGVSNHFSPISRETKAASGLVELPRFDTKVMCTFFVTQDPSVGGFSGAPIFDTRLPHSIRNAEQLIQIGREPRILGLVHGTLSDNTGGKFAAIVPSFIILEVLEQASPVSPK